METEAETGGCSHKATDARSHQTLEDVTRILPESLQREHFCDVLISNFWPSES